MIINFAFITCRQSSKQSEQQLWKEPKGLQRANLPHQKVAQCRRRKHSVDCHSPYWLHLFSRPWMTCFERFFRRASCSSRFPKTSFSDFLYANQCEQLLNVISGTCIYFNVWNSRATMQLANSIIFVHFHPAEQRQHIARTFKVKRASSRENISRAN